MGQDYIDAQAFEFVKQTLGLGGLPNTLAALERDEEATFDRVLFQPVTARSEIQRALRSGSQLPYPLSDSNCDQKS